MYGTVQGLTEISQVHHPKTFAFLAPLFARHQYIATISSHQLATAEQPQNFAGCLTNWLMLHFLTGSSTGLQTCWLHCHWTSKWLLSLNNAFPQSSHVQTLYFMAQWYCILFITVIRWLFWVSRLYDQPQWGVDVRCLSLLRLLLLPNHSSGHHLSFS